MGPDRSTLVPAGRVMGPLAGAMLVEVLAWVWLFAQVGEGWMARPGALAGVHALTVGALAIAIVGAGWQIVPVVTARPWGWDPAKPVTALVLAGAPLVVLGFHRGPLLVAGLGLVAAGLALRTAAIAVQLARATGRGALRAWIAGAELCLWLGLGVAAALVAGRLGHPVLADHLAGVRWHAALLLAGWVGGWIGGAGALLLPMFSIAAEPSPRALGLAGLLWYGGLWSGQPWLWSAGAALLAALLLRGLMAGLRRGPSLTQAGLGLLGLLLLAAIAPWARWELVGGLALVGFALPVLRGVAQRIGPFLAWTHAFGDHPRGAPSAASLFPERLAWVQLGFSAAGAVLLLGGRAASLPLEPLGAAALAIGAGLHLAVIGLSLLRIQRAQARRAALPGTGVP